jgi:hypothetical protein
LFEYVQDIGGFQPVDVVSCLSRCHMRNNGVKGVHLGWGVVARKRLTGKGQSMHSMGLVWREVLILAQRAITRSKGFLVLLTAAHMLIIHCMLLRYSYFSPL